MNTNLTEIAVILDRSGSMSTVQEDVIGAYNTFIRQQKAVPGQANVTLVLFDDVIETQYSRLPIEAVPELTENTYWARGWTALVDAVARTIKDLGQKLAAVPEEERPGKVIVVINTDGYENMSREYTTEQLAEMVRHQQDVYNWEFLFMGANQDAWQTAAQYGIAMGQTLSYDNATYAHAYTMTSDTISRIRGGGTATYASNDIRNT